MSEAGEGSRRSRLLHIGVLVAVVAGIVAVTQLIPNIDLQKVLNDVATKLGNWTYLVVGVAAFVETGAFVGLVLPDRKSVV